MNERSSGNRTDLSRRAIGFVLGVLVTCLGVFAFAAPARADSFSTEFDHGRINLGFAFKDAEVLPAPLTIKGGPLKIFPLSDLWSPLPVVPVPLNPPNLKIKNGDLTDGDVSIDKDRFQPPIMIVENPLDQSDVPVTLRATDDLAGTYDAGSGELNLTAPFEVRVLVGMAGTPPTYDAYCRVDLGTIAFTTGPDRDYIGSPFRDGITGDGAITGSFIVTEDSEPVGTMNAEELPNLPAFAPPDCSDVDSISKGVGSIWLAHGITDPIPADPPACPEFTEGTPPNCQPIPCPAGTVGESEPDCVRQAAKITRVDLKPARRAIRPGQRIRLRVRVVNRGNAAATVKVRLKSRNRQVRVRRAVRLRVPAGAAAVKPVAVKATGKARGRAAIFAGTAGKRGHSVLTVKPVKRAG